MPGAVCADGEDRLGRDLGAARVLLAPGLWDIEHVGSAHDDVELELLKTAARQRLAAGQCELDLAWRPVRRAGAADQRVADRLPARCAAGGLPGAGF